MSDQNNIETQKAMFLRANYGMLARIARATGKSPGFVTEIYWGRSASAGHVVERELAAMGAPGFVGDKLPWHDPEIFVIGKKGAANA